MNRNLMGGNVHFERISKLNSIRVQSGAFAGLNSMYLRGLKQLAPSHFTVEDPLTLNFSQINVDDWLSDIKSILCNQ